MSKVVKGVGKAFKGIGKAVKSVVKGIVKAGKSLVKGVGKVLGKLGPIGTIALGFIAPYAIGALAGMGGVAGSIGQGLQALGSAVTAPIKAVGSIAKNAFGAAIEGLGGSISNAVGVESMVGKGVTSITDKITSAIGYKSGGSITEGARQIFGETAMKMDKAFGTSLAPAPNVEGIGELAFDTTGSTSDAMTSAMRTPTTMSSDALANATTYTTPADTVVNNVGGAAGVGTNPNAVGSMFDTTAFNPGQASDPLFVDTPVPDILKDTSTQSNKTSGTESLLNPAAQLPVAPVSIEDPGSTNSINAAVIGSDGAGGQGQSFYGQNMTGLMATEDFAANAYALLGGGRRRATA